MINGIASELKKVDYILHVADIHIRNWKRHKEYKEVFEKLYLAVDQLPPNSIVTVGGDIVHAKTDMSPELISMVTGFFEQLGNRVPTIVIAGNHDTNLNNNHRLDALTPILEALKHPNVFYLRDSGVYCIGDLAISVMSLLDPPSKYSTADKLEAEGYDENYKKVAMYHGTIANSAVDSGLVISHGLDWDTFAGFDLVLLGDIHKRQILVSSDPLVFYPGSLLQQSFGESFEGHGYAFLDLKDYKVTFHDIPNQYSFYTIDVEGGVLPKGLPISAKTNVRLRIKGTSSNQLKDILATLRKEYGVVEVTVNDLDRIGGGSTSDQIESGIYQGDIRNPQIQRQLIADYYKDSNIDPLTLSQVLAISDQLNSQLNHAEVARGVVWKPKHFEFSNMFSYGEGNVIDFEKLNGTCGLFAPNHTGKSAILDALCFCLFDYTSRASKADQVLNNKKDWFSCKFTFELDGCLYTIHKQASRYKKGPLAGRLRVDIDFSYVNQEGETVSLNGEQRRDTDRIIQSYVGTFDDFVLTALSMQGNSSNFVEKTQGERKELLANFLDLATFDLLFELANKEVKSITAQLEVHQKQDYDAVIREQEQVRDLAQVALQQLAAERDKLEVDIEDEIAQINQLNKEVHPVKHTGLDIEDLLSKKQQLEQLLVSLKSKADLQRITLDQAQAHQTKQVEQLSQIQEGFSQEILLQCQSNQQESTRISNLLAALKVSVDHKLAKLANLSKHEYDPNCTYCVNNVFVKDAMATKIELEEDYKTGTSLQEKQQHLDHFIELNQSTINQKVQIVQAEQEVVEAKRAVELAHNLWKTCDSTRQLQERSMVELETKIADYYVDEERLKINAKLADQINQHNTSLQGLNSKLKVVLHDYSTCFAGNQVSIHQLDVARRSLKDVDDLLTKLTVYEAYCKAVSKDGIPYTLISRAVPFIQNYVNNILSQVVDFTVILETDGKNINAFIGYDSGRWPLELASGMERFVASLAIRIALIKTTNLPKPDFIAIDEGLGVLDSSNLNSMHTLFTYMKDVFRFSLIISHIDVVRDMVDNIININRKDGFSCINC